MGLFSRLSFEGWIVVLAIAALTVWAVRIWAQAFRRLRNEAAAAQGLLEAQPVDLSEASALLDRYDSAAFAVILRDALAHGRIQEDLFPYDVWIHWPRYLAGVFVFLGLLGTVFGIATAVSSLGGAVDATTRMADSSASLAASSTAFSAERFAGLLEGIDSLLSGMKSAFLCTLAGLASTILLSWLNARYMAVCRALESHIHTLASRVFLPLRQKQEETRALEASARSLSASADTLARNIVPAAEYFTRTAKETGALAAEVGQVAQQMRSQSERAAEGYTALQNVLVEASRMLNEDFAHLERTSQAVAASARGLAQERADLEEVASTVSASAVRMEQAVQRLREELAAAQRREAEQQEIVVRSLQAAHRTLEETLRRFEVILNDITALSEISPLGREIERLKQALLEETRRAEERANALRRPVGSEIARRPARPSPPRPSRDGGAPPAATPIPPPEHTDAPDAAVVALHPSPAGHDVSASYTTVSPPPLHAIETPPADHTDEPPSSRSEAPKRTLWEQIRQRLARRL